MSTVSAISSKQSVSFRWNADLVKHLKDMAKRQNRSLSNFTETLLERAVNTIGKDQDVPNDLTMSAIKEARSDKDLETLDLNNFDEYVNNLQEWN